MKAGFAKVLGLALALALALSGCNLIEVDAKMQADEDIAKVDKAYSAVAASYDGGEVTIGEAMGDFNSSYNQTNYMYYYYFGYQMTESDVRTLAEDVLKQHVRAEIVAAKFDEANSLDDEELEQVASDAQSYYESAKASALESVEGKNDAEREERARVLLRQTGMDYDSYYANLLISAKEDKMEELLRGEIAELSDEELQAAYDAKVAEQEASYTDGSSFESAMTGDDAIVCWRPDGYRTVKHILLIPGDEIKSAYTDAVSALEDAQSDLDTLAAELEAANDGEIEEGERSAEEVQAEIDAIEATVPSLETAVKAAEQACLDDVKASTDEIYEKLEAGESFEDLIAEYGEDPGMQNEPTATRGYYVSAASTNWESNFRDAAMALNQVGEYTAEPVVSGSGVHIIQYTADVLGGEVDLDEVRDALYAEALEDAQNQHCEDTITAWVDGANVSYNVDAFMAVFTEE